MPFPLCPHRSSLVFMSLLPTFCSWHSLILSHPVTIPCKAHFLDPFPICSHLPLDSSTRKTLAHAHCSWSPPDSTHRSSLSLPSVTTILKVFRVSQPLKLLDPHSLSRLSLGSRVLILSILHPPALFFLPPDFISQISFFSTHLLSPDLFSFLNLQFIVLVLNLLYPVHNRSRFLRVVQNDLLVLPFLSIFTSRHPGIFLSPRHTCVFSTSLIRALCTTGFKTGRP